MFSKLLRACVALGVLGGIISSVIIIKDRELSFNDDDTLSAQNILKRQPLNRSQLSEELNRLLESGSISDDAHKIAKVLYQRDKRNSMARLFTALDPENSKDPETFLEVYLPVFSSADYSSQKLFAKTLASLTYDDHVFLAIEAKLLKKPKWAKLVLNEIMLAETRKPEELVPALLEHPDLQSAFLGYYVRSSRVKFAHNAFIRFTEKDTSTFSTPFDQKLLRLEGPTPFNWSVNPKVTEFIPNGGVFLSYSSNTIEYAISQISHLQPGQYIFSSTASGSSPKGERRFNWTINCLENQKTLMDEPLDSLNVSPREHAFNFKVPDYDCDFQRIQLSGYPDTNSHIITAEVFDVRVTPLTSE